jgi:hypothetical protein
MFLTIIPLEKELNEEEFSKYYTDQFITANESFMRLQNCLAMPQVERDEAALKKKRDSLLNYFERGISDTGPSLWHFLETWVQSNHPELWQELAGKKGCLSFSFKNFFNTLFCHGCSEMTHHVQKLMERKKKKT